MTRIIVALIFALMLVPEPADAHHRVSCFFIFCGPSPHYHRHIKRHRAHRPPVVVKKKVIIVKPKTVIVKPKVIEKKVIEKNIIVIEPKVTETPPPPPKTHAHPPSPSEQFDPIAPLR